MDVWEFIYDKLSAKIDVMLLYVLDSEGSSPGRRGFKMAVSADGEMCGTIGGGIMEYKLVERSKSVLQSGIKEISFVKQFHDKTHAKDESGMICSGSQLNLLMPLNVSNSKGVIKQIIEAQKENKDKTIQLSPDGRSQARPQVARKREVTLLHPRRMSPRRAGLRGSESSSRSRIASVTRAASTVRSPRAKPARSAESHTRLMRRGTPPDTL